MGTNFDKEYKDFKIPNAILANAANNKANLESLGIDPMGRDDTVFGSRYIYCDAHGGAHSLGWCESPAFKKRPLNAENISDAEDEVDALFGHFYPV